MAARAGLGDTDTVPVRMDRAQLFEAVTSGCTGLISRIALSYEADPALRRELVQDILLAIWVALPAWRGDAALRTFVASIAQNGFSLRWPWCGNCHDSTARRRSGSPVASLNARSYSW